MYDQHVASLLFACFEFFSSFNVFRPKRVHVFLNYMYTIWTWLCTLHVYNVYTSWKHILFPETRRRWRRRWTKRRTKWTVSRHNCSKFKQVRFICFEYTQNNILNIVLPMACYLVYSDFAPARKIPGSNRLLKRLNPFSLDTNCCCISTQSGRKNIINNTWRWG